MMNMEVAQPMEPNILWLPYLSWFSSPSKVMTAESAKAMAGELEGWSRRIWSDVVVVQSRLSNLQQ